MRSGLALTSQPTCLIQTTHVTISPFRLATEGEGFHASVIITTLTQRSLVWDEWLSSQIVRTLQPILYRKHRRQPARVREKGVQVVVGQDFESPVNVLELAVGPDDCILFIIEVRLAMPTPLGVGPNQNVDAGSVECFPQACNLLVTQFLT